MCSTYWELSEWYSEGAVGELDSCYDCTGAVSDGAIVILLPTCTVLGKPCQPLALSALLAPHLSAPDSCALESSVDHQHRRTQGHRSLMLLADDDVLQRYIHIMLESMPEVD